MRRRLMRFLPVFVLALMVQILAPVGACLAKAVAASDPLAAAVLCQGAGADHDSDRPAKHDMRGGSCAVCAAATPFVPSPPASFSAEITRHVYRVAWQAYASDARDAKISTGAQARAPPVLS